MPATNGPRSVLQTTNALNIGGVAQRELTALLTAVQEDLADLKAKFDAHVHAGVTAGGASTAVPTALSATQKTLP